MIDELVLGFPGQRPGGLVLTVLMAVGAGLSAVVLGLVYATLCVQAPRFSLVLQTALAVLRGVPVLLLVFVLAQATGLLLTVAGALALLLYSFSHVGETLRSFLTAYPAAVREQARVLGLGWVREWFQLRLPWTFHRSLQALGTHWISLLKDTGALTILGIGELTTVARVLSERGSLSNWRSTLAAAALLYLGTTVVLIRILRHVRAPYWMEVATLT